MRIIDNVRLQGIAVHACSPSLLPYIHPNSLGQSDAHQTVYISVFQFATALMAIVRAVI